MSFLYDVLVLVAVLHVDASRLRAMMPSLGDIARGVLQEHRDDHDDRHDRHERAVVAELNGSAAPTSAAFHTVATYSQGDGGQTLCPAGYTLLTDEAECLSTGTATAVGASYVGFSGTWWCANGCFHGTDTDRVYYNTDSVGGCDSHYRAVCKHAVSAEQFAACSHPGHTPSNKWKAMSDMANALNSLGADYNIHGGTVLGLVRSCNIFDSDIDFAVDYKWLVKNHRRSQTVFQSFGLRPGDQFGSLHEKGYEENHWSSFLQDGVGSTIQLTHTSGIKIDLFTVERFADRYVSGLWVKGQYYPCETRSTGTATYTWLGVTVRIPVPVKDALISWYGPNYITPMPWVWNVQPFTVGSCKGGPPP